jgi:hypothetical protein
MCSTQKIRYGITVMTVLAAGALGTQTTAAASPTMTELQAERFMARAVKYTDVDAQAEYRGELAYVRDRYQQACIIADQTLVENRQRCSISKANLTQTLDLGCQCVYKPTQIDCRGASASRDAYHFTRLRCKALFVNDSDITGWRRGYVKPLSSLRASWSWTS